MRPIHALLLATSIWGLTFSLIQDALRELDPVLFVCLRFALAAPFALLLFRKRVHLADRAVMRKGVLLGLSLYAGYMLQTIGLLHTTAARSGLFTSLCVVFVPLLLAIMQRRRPRGGVLLALALVGLGLGLLNPGALQGDWGPTALGDFLTSLAALSFAVQVLLMDRLPGKGEAYTLNFWQISTVAVLAAFSLPFRDLSEQSYGPVVWLALLFCGILATVVALGLQVRYQPEVAPEKAAVVYTMEPVFAALFAWAWLGQALSPLEWAGGVLLCSGLWVIELNRNHLRALRNRLLS